MPIEPIAQSIDNLELMAEKYPLHRVKALAACRNGSRLSENIAVCLVRSCLLLIATELTCSKVGEYLFTLLAVDMKFAWAVLLNAKLT